LLLRAWDLLESGASDLLVARWTELGILDAAGHGPELDACLDCSRAPLEGEELRWDAEAGGIRCATHGEGAPLSSDALRLLRALRRFAPEELAALRLPAAALLEVDRALRGSILTLYGREPRSRSFLDEVMA
jgi:DNA repair protein RecO (recombination protein O)